MSIILCRQRVQDRIEGREPLDWGEHHYTILEETKIGRIYRQQINGDPKWLWFLHVPAPPPNQGTADTLEEAKAALAARYEQIKRGT
jgi:hypothetical protein